MAFQMDEGVASFQQAVIVHLLYAKDNTKHKSSKLRKICLNQQKICIRE